MVEMIFRHFSFFLVLLTAGFELQVSDLRAETFVFGILPCDA